VPDRQWRVPLTGEQGTASGAVPVGRDRPWWLGRQAVTFVWNSSPIRLTAFGTGGKHDMNTIGTDVVTYDVVGKPLSSP